MVSREQLLGWAHAALGYMENEKYAQAEAELRKILAVRPRDRFATRNLAICRELLFQQAGAGRDAAAITAARTQAEQAAAACAAVEPQAAIPRLLQARIAQTAGQEAAAVAHLEEAVRLEPQSPVAWWELYSALGGGQGLSPEQFQALPASRREALLAAGRQVDALQPDNWFFLKDWIHDLAAARQPDVRDVLERLRPQIAPFASFVEQDVRVNPLKFLDAAIQAAQDGQFAAVINALRPLVNVLLRPESPYDQGLLKKHSLEFVLRDFDAAFYDELGRPEVSAAAIPVQFVPFGTTPPGLQDAPLRDMAWIDFDRDGWSDLAVLTADQLRVYRRTPAGEWQPAMAPLSLDGQWWRLYAADLDHDAEPPPSAADNRPSPLAGKNIPAADPDVLLAGPSGVLVLENRRAPDGSRSLVPIEQNPDWSKLRDVTALVLADLDHDGDLDVFVAASTGVHIGSQRGKLQFVDIADRSVLPPPGMTVLAATAIDWDRDVDVDLLLSTSTGLRLLENLRHGRFRDHALDGPLSELAAATSLKVRDLDGNGAFDVVAAGPRGVQVVWREPPAAAVGVGRERNTELVMPGPVNRAALWDYDNDGLIDLVAASSSGIEIFRQVAPGKMERLKDALPGAAAEFALPADIDQDGDFDLWTGPAATAWRNDGGNAHHWMTVHLFAQQEKGAARSDSKRVNHEGIGSLVELRAGERYQAAIVEGQSTHFGLGTATRADLLRVLWTNGVPNSYLSPAVDAHVFEEQLPIGSCPYLYTWDGARFVFCTDLLWNAPLGLRFAEGSVAAWREWEYLKIDGRQLQPREQRYELRITEELWEAAYFDQIKLFAVDHPREWQVFTNEKVGPADLATPLLHVVRNPRPPAAARDPRERDVLRELLVADGEYARTYDRRLASGLVTDHFLELDLGDLAGARRITLFLTGWLFPTDTSLNVQLSQHPMGPRPRPPSLWTPDARGEWREVRPFTGFIGGKPKTIAIDVSDVFTPGDYRLRIATNMEFAWDAAFFTVDETPLPFSVAESAAHLAQAGISLPIREESAVGNLPAFGEVRVRELPLRRADLHYRGFSQAVHRPGAGPEDYDYQRVSRESRWPPLNGHFTRYGDVRPLLLKRDDHLAVFGAGDELELSFDAADDRLPAGWVRDFVLYNVGWDKDSVLNTVYGQSVEPLPFAAMTAYGHREGHTRPFDAGYQRYLETYQTRRQHPAEFWNLVRNLDASTTVWPRSRFDGE
jgi:tetratricopeptide (TPR) repeat protein